MRIHRVYLFDSFAEQQAWKHDLKDIKRLIEQMIRLANLHGMEHQLSVAEDWIAQPISVHPVQTNGYDCGIWVLSSIAAVLRGADVTGLSEDDMPWFHRLLLTLVLTQND